MDESVGLLELDVSHKHAGGLEATKLDVMAAPAPGGMMVRPKTTSAHIASEDTSEV
jgi:hypothetical protein